MDQKVIAYIGVGSNQGEREAWIRRAIEALGALAPKVRVLRVSPLYETPPLVEREISPEEKNPEAIPWFVNGVIEIETSLGAEALFDELQKIEEQLGRKRPKTKAAKVNEAPKPFLSRNIDLDLLFYGDEVIRTEKLTVPHPRAHERPFVMLPMRDLRPEYVIPGVKRTVSELCEAPLESGEIRRVEAHARHCERPEGAWQSRERV